MNNNNRKDWINRTLGALNKKTERTDFMDGRIEIAYSNYMYYSRVLNYTSKLLELNKEKLPVLRGLIDNYKENIELLQTKGSSTEINDIEREIKKTENEIKLTEYDIEITEIQIEALKATINKEKEILLKAGVELPDISETKEHQGVEYDE